MTSLAGFIAIQIGRLKSLPSLLCVYICNYLLEHGDGIFREAITMQSRQLFLTKFKWCGATIANWPDFLHHLNAPTLLGAQMQTCSRKMKYLPTSLPRE